MGNPRSADNGLKVFECLLCSGRAGSWSGDSAVGEGDRQRLHHRRNDLRRLRARAVGRLQGPEGDGKNAAGNDIHDFYIIVNGEC